MALYSSQPTLNNDRETGLYPLQDLKAPKDPRVHLNSLAPPQPTNPFISNAEYLSSVAPIEEYIEEEEEEEEEEEDMDDAALKAHEHNSSSIKTPTTAIKPASSRHPYGRSSSNTNTLTTTSSSTSTAAPPPISNANSEPPRQHSRINLLTPPNPSPTPPIICLHGTNDSCMRSWLSLIEVLYKSGHTVLLYDRPSPTTSHAAGGADLKPHRAVSELCSYLYSADLRPPYVFLAHSYGGCIARLFLQQKPHQVAGMVLVETGQETALAPATEEEQYRRPILGDAPLAVVRGNVLRGKQDEWVAAAAAARSPQEKALLEPQRLILEQWDAEDLRLKRKQLGLSRNSRFAQLPDCGHHPIRDRPDLVIEEVKWVMAQLGGSANSSGAPELRRNLSSASAGLRRGFSTRLQSGLQRTFSRRKG